MVLPQINVYLLGFCVFVRRAFRLIYLRCAVVVAMCSVWVCLSRDAFVQYSGFGMVLALLSVLV